MTPPSEVVFLFDVDNTLLDNDRVLKDLRRHMECQLGAETRDRYFAILEELRAELGYTDYLGALQRYRLEDMCDPRLLMMSSFLVDYPFANRLYPGSLAAALEHVCSWGPTVILSDGDVVFQPGKEQFYTGAEIHWFGPQGGLPNWADPKEKRFACVIHEDEQRALFLMFNAGADAVDFGLPPVPPGGRWHLVVDTSREAPQDLFAAGEEPLWKIPQTYHLSPRSSAILLAR